MGLALCWASVGCSSSSDSGKNDGGVKRDTGGNRDVPYYGGRDTAGSTCTAYDGTVYQSGQSFTINCVRYTCQGNDDVTSSGSPCSDGSADLRGNADASRDLPAGNDARADAGDVPGNRDAAPDSGNRDTTPGEVAAIDTLVAEVLAVDVYPADVIPPGPDVTAPVDEAPPVQCTYLGQKYGVGVPFACDCNTCKCDGTGTIVLVTNFTCGVDAQ
jgi:hypothetical protein